MFEIENQPFPKAKKLSHALIHRRESIISFNLKTASLFFPFKRIILLTLTCRVSAKSFSPSQWFSFDNISRKPGNSFQRGTHVRMQASSQFPESSPPTDTWLSSPQFACPQMLDRHPQSLSRPQTLNHRTQCLSATRRLIIVTAVLFVHAYFNTVYRVSFVLRRRHNATGSNATNVCSTLNLII